MPTLLSKAIEPICTSSTPKPRPLARAMRYQNTSREGPVVGFDGFVRDYSSSDKSELAAPLQNTNTRPL
jgi:hypothetical protein